MINNKVYEFFKKNFIWLLCFCFFLVFLIIGHSILRKEILELDKIVYNFINSFSTNKLTLFFKIITQFAGGYILVGICILTFLFIKKKRYFTLISLNLINTTLFNQILKLMFARERPFGIAIIDENGYSFPSGHSMAAMSFYGLLIYIIFKSKISTKIKYILIIILSLLILLIGISRIYLGVHYTSDVIGGFCLSVSYLIIFTRIIEDYLWEVKENE